MSNFISKSVKPRGSASLITVNSLIQSSILFNLVFINNYKYFQVFSNCIILDYSFYQVLWSNLAELEVNKALSHCLEKL